MYSINHVKNRLPRFMAVIIASCLLVIMVDGSIYSGDNTYQSWDNEICSNNQAQNLLDAPWAKAYGGTSYDYAYSVHQTSDGGYIVAGETDSAILVFKLNSSGNVIWRRRYAEASGFFTAYSIQQTSLGGYILAGEAGNDAVVLLLESTGNIQWRRTIRNTTSYYSDNAKFIQQTSDGGFILAGQTNPTDNPHLFVIKLDYVGNILWRRSFGGWETDYANSIQQTTDGGYLVVGQTYSFSDNYYGDTVAMKLNTSGNILWRRLFENMQNAYSIYETSDGGCIVAGDTSNFGAGGTDVLVIKLNSSGNIQWRRTFGGTSSDTVYSIQQTSDGGYILAGETYSFGAGGNDVLIIKLNSSGNIMWRRTFGGTGYDAAYSVQQTSDTGYIVAGTTSSYGAGSSDALILKLDANGSISGCSMTAPGLSISAPNIQVSAPTLMAWAPNLYVNAPALLVNVPTIATANICP